MKPPKLEAKVDVRQGNKIRQRATDDPRVHAPPSPGIADIRQLTLKTNIKKIASVVEVIFKTQIA